MAIPPTACPRFVQTSNSIMPFYRNSLALMILGLGIVVASRSALSLGVDLRVTADRVNLRALADGNSEVVDQVSTDEIVKGKGSLDGQWVEIVPPADVDLWIHRGLVSEGVVTESRVRVRCGPGLSYRPVGELEKGDHVLERGQAGEWLRIAPPAQCSLWISSKYVEPLSPASEPEGSGKAVESEISQPPEAGEAAPPGKDKTEEREPAPERKPSVEIRMAPVAPPEHTLIKGREQGTFAEYTGKLARARLIWFKPSSFRLVNHTSEGGIEITCYVIGDEEALSESLGKDVLVSGREYWVQDSRCPVVAADRIAGPEQGTDRP